MKSTSSLSRILLRKLFLFWLGNWKKSRSKGNLFMDMFLSGKGKPKPNQNIRTDWNAEMFVTMWGAEGLQLWDAGWFNWWGWAGCCPKLSLAFLTKPSPRQQSARAQFARNCPLVLLPAHGRRSRYLWMPVQRGTKAPQLFPGTSTGLCSHWHTLACANYSQEMDEIFLPSKLVNILSSWV